MSFLSFHYLAYFECAEFSVFLLRWTAVLVFSFDFDLMRVCHRFVSSDNETCSETGQFSKSTVLAFGVAVGEKMVTGFIDMSISSDFID